MVYTETALYHETVSKTQQQKDHQINPEPTYYSLSSDQWAAKTHSFILLTSNIFKKIPEKWVFSWLPSLQQGTRLPEVFAFATERCRQFWAWMAQVSTLAAHSKTHVSNPLFLASYTLLGKVCKKQEKKPVLPKNMTVNKSLSNPRPPLASLKSKSKFSEQLLLCNGSFLWKSGLQSWQPQKFLSSWRQFHFK